MLECDLIDKKSLAKYKKYEVKFTLFDFHTKYALAIPLHNKSGTTATQASKTLLQKKGKTNTLSADRCKKFYTKTFLDFLKQTELQIYSTTSDLNDVFVERFYRTLFRSFNRTIVCWRLS